MLLPFMFLNSFKNMFYILLQRGGPPMTLAAEGAARVVLGAASCDSPGPPSPSGRFPIFFIRKDSNGCNIFTF